MSKILKTFLKNEAAIRRYIGRYNSDTQDIEDFSQETFLKCFAAEMRTDIREPKAFLFKVAKHTVLADLRKNKRKPTERLEDLGGAELILDEGQPSAVDDLDGRRKLAVFAMAVAHLPPKCRKAFLMRRVDGLPYKQIANRMNISVSAVEKHVTTGLIKCHAYFKERGFALSEFGAVAARSSGSTVILVEKAVQQDE